MRMRAAVLISGNGSNLQALLDNAQNLDIKLVISSKPMAYGLCRARRAGIKTIVVPSDKKKQEADKWISDQLQKHRIQFVLLAGYMRLLGKEFVGAYKGRLLNIHPSLLPKYPGLRGFESALENNDPVAGVTVHEVTAEMDAGPKVLQRAFRVPQNVEDSLKWCSLHVVEQKTYAESVRKHICRLITAQW